MNLLRSGLLFLTVLLVATTASATTRSGSANRTSAQLWSFTPGTDGDIQLTLSWANQNARLLMVLVCGFDEDTFVTNTSFGVLNRFDQMQVGLLPGVPCLLGVASLEQQSGYRLHFNHTSSVDPRNEGREPLAEVGRTGGTPVDPQALRSVLTTKVEGQLEVARAFYNRTVGQ